MKEYISDYIKRLNDLYKTNKATEHSYRLVLLKLLEETTLLKVINEEKHIKCGAPDLTLHKKGDVPVAYVETKDIGDGDLDGRKKNKEQFDRYKEALDTIVFTDYLDFHLYHEGKLMYKVELAYEQNGKIILNEDNVDKFESLINTLRYAEAQTISSPKKLAQLMANKAKLIAESVKMDLANDTEQNGSLYNQLKAFKDVLNRDIDENRFADLYAQTIAYGFFAARIHDESPDKFTIKEAADLIPETNPFLRRLFQDIAAYNINKSIAWIVNDLVTIFAATDVKKLRKNFETEFQKRDPMIHFYEDFLACYNPAAKKKYGVFYTPQPVVEFMVRAVDDILINDFGLLEGLADTSKVDTPVEKGISQHRVQILDPATGTGTFLAEVVRRIKKNQQPGIWPKYVKEHLLPRVYGFEYMIAPYTIAHLKLDMLMNLSAADKMQLTNEDRVNIYLTNSLIKDDIKPKYIFAQEIANEANKANKIKHSAPVMVMLGNPPYAVSSNNKGPDFAWIEELLKDYKRGLNEKKLNLDDDYIKFIRLAQYYVERTGEGVVAYISNNSFIDGITHRQMRRELLRCFDDIYILNLHGDSHIKETTPNGEKDENVFSIRQGVSINIFIKRKEYHGHPAEVHHYNLYGTRTEKYKFLSENNLSSIKWHRVHTIEPNFLFVPVDYSKKDEYEKGFKIDELMRIYGSGIESQNDRASIAYTNEEREKLKMDFIELSVEKIREKYGFKDGRDWKIVTAKEDISNHKIIANCLHYRPFDFRYMNYTGYSRSMMAYPRYEIMRNIGNGNVTLLVKRGFPYQDRPQGFVSEYISDRRAWSCSGMRGAESVFPLYLYPEPIMGVEQPSQVNLDENIWRTIENWVKYSHEFKPLTAKEQSGELGFDAEPEEPHFLIPEDIFDYIYGVLHSPLYREKYKEFLKVDFPRIPYPKNADEFEHFKECGHKLRELHLMHNVPDCLFPFDIVGSDIVEQPHWREGRVYINDSQYFDKVPEVAWNMFIGGYQPAQKWLKDRKGRTLSTDEKKHYEKIIYVLVETIHIMNSIDDPTAQVEELKKQVQTLEQQLEESQKSAKIVNYGTINFNDNSKNLNLG